MKPGLKCFLKLILTTLVFFLWTSPVYALPYISSQYYCLLDNDSGQVLLSHNADAKRQVASTTKMMTAILAVEYADLDEKAVVSNYADKTPEYTIGLHSGQEILIEELLKVSLVRSANDAAVVLAEHVAGDEKLFAHLMSLKAFSIGAMNTHFANASGLPDNDNYSTAYDLGIIAQCLLRHDYLSTIVGTQKCEFQHPSYAQALTITNTNKLLGSYQGANGIKTGTTDAAGKCLVASANRQNRQLIAIALRANDRVGDCMRLLDYGFDTRLKKVIDSTVPFKQLKLANGRQAYTDIYPAEDLYLWQAEGKPNIEKAVIIDYSPVAPIEKGEKLGELKVYTDDKLIKNIDLICRQSIEKENLLLRKFF